MKIEEVESLLKGLLKGEFSSLALGFNDDHACDYKTAKGWQEEYNEYNGSENERISWVSEEERIKAVEENSVWTLQWYPSTPVGFICLGASSLRALIAGVEAVDSRE